MIARRSVWPNPEIQELLKGFVPAADEVHRLQSQKGDPEVELFQLVAEQGHYGGRTQPTNTRQGIYAFSAAGEFLGSRNTHNIPELTKMMREALEKYSSLPKERRIRAVDPASESDNLKRWENRYPSDGLVLRVYSRDLPRERQPQDWRADAWNQDYAWFRKEEVQQIVPEGGRGSSVDWPGKLVNRLARTALVDVVRGQSPPYGPNDVRQAELRSEITAVEGDKVEMAISGQVYMGSQGRWSIAGFKDLGRPSQQERGTQLALYGTATFDRKQDRFVQFEVAALGTRQGGTQYNGRTDDLAPAPIGFALVLAGESPSERVAPANIWAYGW